MGNAALIVIATAPMLPIVLRVYSLLSGTLAILALVGYSSGHYLGLGEGGIERVVAYPQTVWLIEIGLFLLVRIRHLQRTLKTAGSDGPMRDTWADASPQPQPVRSGDGLADRLPEA